MSLLTITTSIASLCKFTIGGTNFICSSLSGINLANGLVGIDNNKVFKISTKTAQPSSIKFKMIDFTDNTNIEKWSSSISCPGASWTTYHSEAILISADSKVGVLVGYNNLLLFLFLNIQTGAAANSGYKTVSTSGSCSNSISLKMIGNYIIGIFKWAKNYIFVFDYANTSMMNYIETTTTTLNFLDGYYTGSYAYLAGYFTSGSNNIGHIGKGSISAIVGQDNLYYSSFSTQILTNSDYPLTSDSITTTTASTVATSPVMTFTVDTSSFYYPDATTYTTDISFWLNTLYYTQSDKTVNIPLTWSVSGSTSISYSIQQYSTYELPSWVSLDSTNMILTINAPTISATTIYGLKIVSTINSKSYPKIIYITVAGSSSSSSGGTSSSSSTNSTSSSSTSTSSTSTKAKTPITTTVKSTMIATQSAIGSGMAIGLSTSILTSSSAQGIWTFMNQFQMFLILNLLGADFPQDIKDYLDNMSFSTFSFDFIPTYNFPLINIYYGYFSWDEENQDYLISGINYSCSIINNAQLFLICVTYAWLHLIIYLIYLKLNQLMNFLGKIIRKVYEYMTFNIYLRTLVEGFLFLYLSTLHEIYLSDFNKSGRILSFVLGVLIYIMLLALSLFVIYQWYKSLNSNFDIEKSKFSELFEGLKETKWGKLFHTVF